jgi:uncharacterized membrane protein YsdA (DUF1294 family)
MNKKGEFDISELNPIALVGGALGAIVSMIVIGKVPTSPVIKIATFAITFIVCTLVCNKIFSD